MAQTEVLSTFPSCTVDFVIPVTVPAEAEDTKGAFASRAVCIALLTGFAESAVLSTFPSCTIDFLMSVPVPVKAGDASGALDARLVITLFPSTCNA